LNEENFKLSELMQLSQNSGWYVTRQPYYCFKNQA